MKITESKLRSLIRSVIAENLEAMGSAKKITGSVHPYKAEGDLFRKVNQFMKDTLSLVMDPECDIVWSNKSPERDLMFACRHESFDTMGEDIYNYNELIDCEFEVQSRSSRFKNTTFYNFINTCGNCKSFTVKAQVVEMDGRNLRFGDVVLSIEPFRANK